jgi:hypothetical protein
MELRERTQPGRNLIIDFAAQLTNTSQQSVPRPAKASVLPARVLFAWIALSPL